MIIDFYQFGTHVFRQCAGCTDSSLTATHNHHVLHVHIMFLTHYFTDEGYVVFHGHEVSDVVEFQLIIATRNDGFLTTFDRNNMIRVFRTAEELKRLIENLARLA